MRSAVRSSPISTCSRRDRRRLAGDGCRHEGVAVAVAADPRPDPHERLDHGRALSGGDALERVIHPPVDVGHRGVERLVEHRHDGAHLVGGRGLLRAQRRGAPERVDLLEHAPARAALVGTAAQRRAVLDQQGGEAADGRRDRAAPGLGRVRGEDGMEAQALQALQRRVVADLGREPHEGRRDRVGRVLLLGPAVALPQDAHALVLLGQVHEVEVAREGPRDLVGALHREGVGDLRGALERLGRLVGVGVDRRRAQALDVLEEPG